MPWGGWGEWIECARQDFSAFVAYPRALSRMENVTARLLLQLHPAIPGCGYMEEANIPHTETDLERVLVEIHFVRFCEDEHLSRRVGDFLGLLVRSGRQNVTEFTGSDADLNVPAQWCDADAQFIDKLICLDKIVWRHAVQRNETAVAFAE